MNKMAVVGIVEKVGRHLMNIMEEEGISFDKASMVLLRLAEELLKKNDNLKITDSDNV